MNINAKLTLLVSRDRITIEVTDAESRIEFLSLELTPEQWCRVLGREANTSCEKAEVVGLEHVGKTMECQPLEFQLPDVSGTSVEIAKREAIKIAASCQEGWEPVLYFGSRESFFTRDGKPWARTTIRRWVAKEGGA